MFNTGNAFLVIVLVIILHRLTNGKWTPPGSIVVRKG